MTSRVLTSAIGAVYRLSVMNARIAPVAVLGSLLLLDTPAHVAAQAPADLWAPVLHKIRDQSTLNPLIVPRLGYSEVFFDSEIGDANWGDSGEPYEVHTGGTIRIHGYLAAPLFGGPYPAIVIGHGHHGRGDPDLARTVAALGYVALAIDGPQAGLSTGGPEDTEQAWLTVEPSPDYGFLYHYAYAGMRALTLLQRLGEVPGNPFRIDAARLGVMGASMGGQFTYYVNGVDDRVKAAVAIAVAGDWFDTIFYEGSWLYHGLYYYTRDGLRSGVNAPNAVADVCADATLDTFLQYFDPASYAPTQHGPLLTVVGSHDQYFPVPAINVTFDRVRSAGTDPGFASRLLITPNGKHGVTDNGEETWTTLSVLLTINAWLRHAFYGTAAPPETPTLQRLVTPNRIYFVVPARPGDSIITSVNVHYATQIDTNPEPACDFNRVWLLRFGSSYIGSIPIGETPACGPPVTAGNVISFASVSDLAGFTVSSRLYRGGAEMSFSPDFAPVIEHFPRDTFPVPPAPLRCPVR
jgi:cephalosporin-C deacetylase-like acetyl esterase